MQVKKKSEPYKAIALVRVPGAGPHESYKSVTHTIQDGKIIDTDASEGNLKSIAVESLKIAFVREFINRE